MIDSSRVRVKSIRSVEADEIEQRRRMRTGVSEERAWLVTQAVRRQQVDDRPGMVVKNGTSGDGACKPTTSQATSAVGIAATGVTRTGAPATSALIDATRDSCLLVRPHLGGCPAGF